LDYKRGLSHWSSSGNILVSRILSCSNLHV
jgi:hypothetical protein